MNLRNVSERFDDIVMGEIASAAVMQYLGDRGNRVVAYDEIRVDSFRDPDPGWDLLVGDALADWPGEDDDVSEPPNAVSSISVKSSRIPEADGDDILQAIARRDFKILWESENLEKDLSSDYESQVYYRLGDSAFSRRLRIREEDVLNEEIEAIRDGLRLDVRYGQCYLVGFASRRALIRHSRELQARGEPLTWDSWHAGRRKRMWRAPLALAQLPSEEGLDE